MKIKQIFPVVALAIIVFAGAASAQQRKAPPKLPTVNLRDVAKEVTPEGTPGERDSGPTIFEVNPSSISGKLLILPPGSGNRSKWICIGIWNWTDLCKGILITW